MAPKGRTTMPYHDGSTTYALGACCDEPHEWHAEPASRRRFLQTGAALAAASAAVPLLPATSIAQSADPELIRLTGARRILIKGGVVLTLDRQVGDFAQADILIEDGKIREALIRALQETGLRAVHSYHRGSGPAAQYPQDIKRLARTYFSSHDQLLRLALTANLNASIYALARDVGVPVVQHLVGNNLTAP